MVPGTGTIMRTKRPTVTRVPFASGLVYFMQVRRCPPCFKLLLTCISFTRVTSRTVTLSNTALPSDQRGIPLITGEASVLAHSGFFYWYMNDWGSCPGVNCCYSAAGCASCCFADPPHPMQACSNPYGLNRE